MVQSLSPISSRPSVGRASQLVQDVLPVDPGIVDIFPQRGLRKGSVLRLRGSYGSGLYSFAVQSLVAASQHGAWVALFNVDDLGYGFLLRSGVDLERTLIIHDDQHPSRTLATLLESFAIVVTPPNLSLAQMARLSARARERSSIIISVERVARSGSAGVPRWEGGVDLTVYLRSASWAMDLESGITSVNRGEVVVTVEHHGVGRTVVASAS
jgi:hypothetical protein